VLFEKIIIKIKARRRISGALPVISVKMHGEEPFARVGAIRLTLRANWRSAVHTQRLSRFVIIARTVRFVNIQNRQFFVKNFVILATFRLFASNLGGFGERKKSGKKIFSKST
jgi:hypothetical protein